MFFIEDDDFLTTEQKEYIDNVIVGGVIPYYHNSSSVHGADDYSFLTHVIIKRRHERNNTSEVNSPQLNFMKSMLDGFCTKHDIQYTEILRCAINYTYYNGAEASPIHVDEEDEHQQLLIYLNEPQDLNSHTVIFDEDASTELKRVTPKKFRGICFDANPHYAIYPKVGHRIVAVYTFK